MHAYIHRYTHTYIHEDCMIHTFMITCTLLRLTCGVGPETWTGLYGHLSCAGRGEAGQPVPHPLAVHPALHSRASVCWAWIVLIEMSSGCWHHDL